MILESDFISIDEAIEISGFKERYLRRILREKGVTRIGKNYVKGEFIKSFRIDKSKSNENDNNIMSYTVQTNKPQVINSSSAKSFVEKLLNN
jgi:hypothetical protein